MPRLPEWTVPAGAQPKPEDYDYDLDRALGAVVGIRSIVPADAFSAETLGTERAGNGVLIREDGVVLTIGYLITEAEQIWLTFSDGRVAPGHVLGYDQETGFGLVQALARIDLRADSARAIRRAARSASAWWSAAPAAVIIRSRRASPPGRNSPATGNTCSTRRSSPRRRIPTGAAPR